MGCVSALMQHLWYTAAILKWKFSQFNYSELSYQNYMDVEQLWKFAHFYFLLYSGPISNLLNIEDHKGTNSSAP